MKIVVPSYKFKRVVQIESRTSPGVYYTVKEDEDGKVTCSCWAHKECWHIEKYNELYIQG